MESMKYTPSSSGRTTPFRRRCLLRLSAPFLLLLVAGLTTYSFARSSHPSADHRRPFDPPSTKPPLKARAWNSIDDEPLERTTNLSSIEPRSLPAGVVQISTPPRIPGSVWIPDCRQQLATHIWGSGRNKNWKYPYTPPVGCKWTNVLFELEGSVKGQRPTDIGSVYLDDNEVWRFSTPESEGDNVGFRHVKDMTHVSALLRTPRNIFFGMNIPEYMDHSPGEFELTLTAVFYTPPSLNPPNPVKPASMVIPLRDKVLLPGHSLFQVEEDKSVSPSNIPKNTIRLVMTMLVSPAPRDRADLWFTNPTSPYKDSFPENPLTGWGPWREMELYSNGVLAGVLWPMPVMYPGGIVPNLWNPIAGPHGLDIPEYEVDLTPFLPDIIQNHNSDPKITFCLPGAAWSVCDERKMQTTDDWWVTGRLHIWQDPDPLWITSGTRDAYRNRSPANGLLATGAGKCDVYQDGAGRNQTLHINDYSHTHIAIESTINTSKGPQKVAWVQGVHHMFSNVFNNYGNERTTDIAMWGNDNAGPWGIRSWRLAPFRMNRTKAAGTDNWKSADVLWAMGVRGTGRLVDGVPLAQEGRMGSRIHASKTVGSPGTAKVEQAFVEVKERHDGQGVEMYGRMMQVVGGVVTQDHERINGKDVKTIGEKPSVHGQEGEKAWNALLKWDLYDQQGCDCEGNGRIVLPG